MMILFSHYDNFMKSHSNSDIKNKKKINIINLNKFIYYHIKKIIKKITKN